MVGLAATQTPAGAYQRPGRTERILVSADGTEGNRHSQRPAISSGGEPGNGPSHLPGLSPDGRYVTFVSLADNLVPGDDARCLGGLRSCADMFVHNRLTGETERVSVAGDGSDRSWDSNADTGRPATISADGKVVAFWSLRPDLVVGDVNDQADVFVFDQVLDRGSTAPQFTAAEERLMGHLAEGCSLKVIASRLGVTSRTVERRLARVRERFGLDTTAELKAVLARMGR